MRPTATEVDQGRASVRNCHPGQSFLHLHDEAAVGNGKCDGCGAGCGTHQARHNAADLGAVTGGRWVAGAAHIVICHDRKSACCYVCVSFYGFLPVVMSTILHALGKAVRQTQKAVLTDA